MMPDFISSIPQLSSVTEDEPDREASVAAVVSTAANPDDHIPNRATPDTRLVAAAALLAAWILQNLPDAAPHEDRESGEGE